MKADQHQRPAPPTNGVSGEGEAQTRAFLAPEAAFSPRDLFRLGAWGAGAIGALIFAFWLSGQSLGGGRIDDARASQAMATMAPSIDELRRENRRLAAALDVLNNDRDRLYARLTIVEKETSDAKASLGNIADTLTTPAPTTDLTLATAQHFTQIVMGSSPHGFVFGLPAPDGVAAKPSDSQTKASSRSAMAEEPSTTGSVPTNGPAPASGSASVAGDVAAPTSEAAKPSPGADAPAIAASAPAAGIALSRSSSMLKLQKTWNALSRKYKAILQDKTARLAIAGSSEDGSVDLALVAGPFADDEAVRAACAVLAKDKRPCAPAPFAGQDLAAIAASASASEAAESKKPPESEPHAASRKPRSRTAEAQPHTPNTTSSPSPFRVFFNNR